MKALSKRMHDYIGGGIVRRMDRWGWNEAEGDGRRVGNAVNMLHGGERELRETNCLGCALTDEGLIICIAARGGKEEKECNSFQTFLRLATNWVTNFSSCYKQTF